MATPAANNKMSSYMAHHHRKKYVRLAYPIFDDDKSIDFWYGDKVLYGRVDHNNRPATLISQNLSNIQESPDVFVLNFVADAYEDFRDYINEAVTRRKIDYENSWIKTMRPLAGYIDPQEIQGRVLDSVHSAFSIEFYDQSDQFKKVANIHDYVNIFFVFFKKFGGATPISLTSQFRTNLISPLTSGLALDLTKAPHDLDAIKYKLFLQDRNFKFYQNAVRKFGFRLDVNAPWRIVADIASAEMLQYMRKYGFNSYQEMFDNSFLPTGVLDLLNLKNFIFDSYNDFANRFPFSKHTKVTKNGQRLKSCFTDRSPITKSQYNKMFTVAYWLKFYFNIRCIEARVKISKKVRSRIMGDIEKIQKDLDIIPALRYIDSVLSD